MKSILFITAFPPNQQTAGQNYTRNLLNDLAESNAVDLIYFDYVAHKVQIAPAVRILRRYSATKISKFFSALKIPFIHPFFTCRFHYRLLVYLFTNASNYDILYLDFSQMFIYSLFVRHPRKILMAHDVILQKFSRRDGLLSNLRCVFVRISENYLLKSATEVYCFSVKDALLLKENYKVNAEVVSFYFDKYIDLVDITSLEISDYFILYGAWNRPENENGLLWFFQNVYEHLVSIRIKIIGPNLSPNALNTIKKFKNVEYLGFVKNPYEYIFKSQGLIAPVFEGAGVKVKVLEALACGTDVIGTDVALEGIEISDSDGFIFRANTVNDFVKNIQRHKMVSIYNKENVRLQFYNCYPPEKFVNYL